MKNSAHKIYDAIIIGGGPAGMMSAGRLAERHLKVLLLEKNPDVGKKLLITGGGRCNVTNAEENNRKLLAKYKDSDKFLFSAFAQYSVKDTLHFFHSRGVETKVEDNGRVFPVSDKAKSVWEALKNYLKQGKVEIRYQSEVTGFKIKDGKIDGVNLKDGSCLKAKSYILATGGKSRPETGSTGEGFRWLKKLGHNVIEPDVSLVPITINEKWISQLAGISLPEVKISVWQDNKKQLNQDGKILFTHVGISGPTVLNMSKSVRELLSYGPVIINLDLLPKLDKGDLDKKILEIFQEHNNKQLKNVLSHLLPTEVAKLIILLSNISPDKQCNCITRDERKILVDIMKNFPLKVKGLLSESKAIITSGGVDLREVNFKTMQSRLHNNLYIVGDLLNIDRPSGGYSLQLCWTTGFVAGNSALTS
jgi:predicted Rossmann fold flavoprotein